MDTTDVRNTLKAISQESRWDILSFIANYPDSCAKEVSNHVGIPPSTLSFHLKQLIEVDMLEVRSEGRETHYRLKTGTVEKTVAGLRALLNQ